MRKQLVLLALPMLVLFSCTSKKKSGDPDVVKSPISAPKYEEHIKPILAANCAPCHMPSKGGRVKALETYAEAKSEVDDIIKRITRAPMAPGFMPKGKPKLDPQTIAMIEQWQKNGMPQ